MLDENTSDTNLDLISNPRNRLGNWELMSYDIHRERERDVLENHGSLWGCRRSTNAEVC